MSDTDLDVTLRVMIDVFFSEPIGGLSYADFSDFT